MKITIGIVFLLVANLSAAQAVGTSSSGGVGGIIGDILYSLKPLVDSSGLQRTISLNNLLDHAKQLVKFSKLSDGTRVFGSAGHNATVNYIKKTLDKTGYYDTEFQTFPYLFSAGTSLFSANATNYPSQWFTYGPAGDVQAPLVIVNNLGCEAADFPATVSGNIALIKRGTCEFGLKTALAGAAGAAAAIIYNNADGGVGGGTLGAISRPEVGPYVPVASITGLDGQALITAITAGSEVIGTLHVDAVNEERYSSNVFATSKHGDKQNIVVTGAHSDSVSAGPGINDDGSGTIGLLEIALQLTRYKLKNAVRFSFWTAEEFGLVGSEYYVTNLPEEERQKIGVYLNFDMIASPNAGYFILDGDGSAFNLTGPAGSDKIEKVFEDYYASAKVQSAPTQFSGRSDYGPFLEVGIPSGGVNTGAEGIKTAEQAAWWGGDVGVAYDKCYHQACDGIDNLNTKAFVINTKAASHAIAHYARSLEGIPRPRPSAGDTTLKVTKLSYDQRRHSACGHEVLLL